MKRELSYVEFHIMFLYLCVMWSVYYSTLQTITKYSNYGGVLVWLFVWGEVQICI